MPVKLYPHPIAALHSLLQLHLPYSLSLYGTAFATPPPPSSQPRTAVPAVAPRLIWTTFQTTPTYRNASSPDPWTAIIAYPAPDRQIRIYNSLEHPSILKTIAPDARPSYVDAAQRQVVRAIEAYIRDVDPGMTYVGKVHEMWLGAVEGYIAGRAAGGAVDAEKETREMPQDGLGEQERATALGAAVKKETCLSRPIDLGQANVALRSRSKWKKQGRYWVWCPPWELSDGNVPTILPDATLGRGDLELEGYEVDIGRDDDLLAFDGPGPSNRIPGYYAARLPYSTVIRANRPDTAALAAQPSAGAFDELWTPVSSVIDASHDDPPVGSTTTSKTIGSSLDQVQRRVTAHYTPVPEAAARIITHPDGSIGALTTLPAHRRRGLARWVVLAHLASGRGRIPDHVAVQAAGEETGARWTYAIVHEGNEASSALWKSMGWERVFRCASVYRTEEDIAAAVAGAE